MAHLCVGEGIALREGVDMGVEIAQLWERQLSDFQESRDRRQVDLRRLFLFLVEFHRELSSLHVIDHARRPDVVIGFLRGKEKKKKREQGIIFLLKFD